MRRMAKKELHPIDAYIVTELAKGPKSIRTLTDLVFQNIAEVSERQINERVNLLAKRRLIKKSQILRGWIKTYNTPTVSKSGRSKGKYESKGVVVFPRRRF